MGRDKKNYVAIDEERLWCNEYQKIYFLVGRLNELVLKVFADLGLNTSNEVSYYCNRSIDSIRVLYRLKCQDELNTNDPYGKEVQNIKADAKINDYFGVNGGDPYEYDEFKDKVYKFGATYKPCEMVTPEMLPYLSMNDDHTRVMFNEEQYLRDGDIYAETTKERRTLEKIRKVESALADLNLCDINFDYLFFKDDKGTYHLHSSIRRGLWNALVERQ